MKVICINNEFSENLLTIGKTYYTNKDSYGYYYIIDDNNDIQYYSQYYSNFCFKTLSELRDDKINRLLR